MYAYALEKGAVLMEAAGRDGVADEYRRRNTSIVEKIRESCWDEAREMLREGPEFCQYTQHAQSWAVLCGLLKGEQAVHALRHALKDEDVLKCSFSTSYEWFRALEQAGLYEETKADMMRWAALPSQGNTTCPETPENSRSECHAWSALPMYEMIRVMAGIRVRQGSAEIAPDPAYLKDISGEAVVPGGRIGFRYTKEEDGWKYEYMLSDGLEAVFVHADGRREKIAGNCILQLIVRNAQKNDKYRILLVEKRDRVIE